MGNNEEFREERRGEERIVASPLWAREYTSACVCANNVNSARKTGRRQPVSH